MLPKVEESFLSAYISRLKQKEKSANEKFEKANSEFLVVQTRINALNYMENDYTITLKSLADKISPVVAKVRGSHETLLALKSCIELFDITLVKDFPLFSEAYQCSSNKEGPKVIRFGIKTSGCKDLIGKETSGFLHPFECGSIFMGMKYLA